MICTAQLFSSRDVCKTACRNSPTGINTGAGARPRHLSGFTIVEVVIAVLISTIVFATVIYAYVGANDRAEWSAYSLAAQSLAMQGIEQARAAQWGPESWPVIDKLPVTNYPRGEKLDVAGFWNPVHAHHYIRTFTLDPSPQKPP